MCLRLRQTGSGSKSVKMKKIWTTKNEGVRKWRRRNPARYLLMSARARAKKYSLEFNLTVDDIVIPATCPVLGIPIGMAEDHANDRRRFPGSPSLDRIDNTKGYIKGNVQVISWRANKLKGDGTLEELEALVRYLRRSEESGS